MAGRRCTVCDCESRVVIDKMLAEGNQSYRNVAKQFGINPNAVWNHATKHLSKVLEAAIERKQQREAKSVVAVAEQATEARNAVADEFLEDIQYSKRFAKLGVERCMSTSPDPETGETKPAPIEEFRLAPGFLASLDRANTLLGQATGRLNQAAPTTVHNHLSVVIPRAVEQQPAIEAQVVELEPVKSPTVEE